MGKALFLGLSAAFFTAYSIIATAALQPSGNITPITDIPGNTTDCSTVDPQHILLPGETCYNQEVSRYPAWLSWFFKSASAAANVFEVATNLFSGFAQLITFQAGLPAASTVTLLIFIPLGFINGYIVFSAIRGSG